jgi:hypothetical protein
MRRCIVMSNLIVGAMFLAACSHQMHPTAGFWYEDRVFALAASDTNRLGGPLAPDDIAEIERISRAELIRAFAELNIEISDRRDAHWRVSVVPQLSVKGVPPPAGGSIELGGLGGGGSVGFITLATMAIRHAPSGATRREMLEGIGRGIGRAAAHEIAHQILGKDMRDDTTDINSYEYFSADRASQYFGTLHWAVARPMLRQKLSR